MQITDGGTDSSVVFTPGPTTRYKWQASGPNPCPRCQELDGQVRTLDAWESSAMPGLHKHCHCKLICVEEVDSGWTFTNHYTHIAGVYNIDGSISHDPEPPGPQHLSKANRLESEGAEDIAPVDKKPYPSQKGPQHLSKRNREESEGSEDNPPDDTPKPDPNTNYSTGFHGQ